MKQKTNKLFRFGGIAFIIAGILFFTRYLFVFSMPAMPASDADLLKWLDDWKFNIAMSNGFFFFATIALIPAIYVLFKIVNESDKIKAILGCGIFAVVISVFTCLVIIQGRLVFPVYDIALSADIQKLVLSIYHGGMHVAFELIGIATIILSFGIKNTNIGKPMMYLGFITGIFDFLNANPWIFGSTIVFISEFLFALWFVGIGVRIIMINKAN